MLPLFSVSYNDFLNFLSEGNSSNYEQSLMKTTRFVKDIHWNDDATDVCKYEKVWRPLLMKFTSCDQIYHNGHKI